MTLLFALVRFFGTSQAHLFAGYANMIESLTKNDLLTVKCTERSFHKAGRQSAQNLCVCTLFHLQFTLPRLGVKIKLLHRRPIDSAQCIKNEVNQKVNAVSLSFVIITQVRRKSIRKSLECCDDLRKRKGSASGEAPPVGKSSGIHSADVSQTFVLPQTHVGDESISARQC